MVFLSLIVRDLNEDTCRGGLNIVLNNQSTHFKNSIIMPSIKLMPLIKANRGS